jgi:hypothetical protein
MSMFIWGKHTLVIREIYPKNDSSKLARGKNQVSETVI